MLTIATAQFGPEGDNGCPIVERSNPMDVLVGQVEYVATQHGYAIGRTDIKCLRGRPPGVTMGFGPKLLDCIQALLSPHTPQVLS